MVLFPHLSLSIVVSLGYVVSCVSEHTAGLSSALARMMIALPTSMFVVHQLRGRRDVVGVHCPSAATARAEQADIVLLARTRESTYTNQISNGHCICATGRETYVTLSSTPRLTPERPCVYGSIVEFAGVKDVLVLIGILPSVRKGLDFKRSCNNVENACPARSDKSSLVHTKAPE